MVKKGELLFVIDQSRYRFELDKAQANLAAAQAAARASGASIQAAGASAAEQAANLAKYQTQYETPAAHPGQPDLRRSAQRFAGRGQRRTRGG